MVPGSAPVSSTPVSDTLRIKPAAAPAGVFIPIIGRGPGMALVAKGGLVG